MNLLLQMGVAVATVIAPASTDTHHPEGQSAVTGRVVEVDFSTSPPTVEALGGRHFYVERDLGEPQSRLVWIAYDCQNNEIERTYPYDDRWTSGGHPDVGDDSSLGPRVGARLQGEPLELAAAIIPVQTATFVVIERGSNGSHLERHGPFDMPQTYCS